MINDVLLATQTEPINELINKITYMLYKYWLEVINNKQDRSITKLKEYLECQLCYEEKIQQMRNRPAMETLYKNLLETLKKEITT